MAGPVGGHAPGVEFHPPRAFTRDPVGIGPPEAGFLDRLVRIDRDVTLGRLGHKLEVMALHHLTSGAIARLAASALAQGRYATFGSDREVSLTRGSPIALPAWGYLLLSAKD